MKANDCDAASRQLIIWLLLSFLALVVGLLLLCFKCYQALIILVVIILGFAFARILFGRDPEEEALFEKARLEKGEEYVKALKSIKREIFRRTGIAVVATMIPFLLIACYSGKFYTTESMVSLAMIAMLALLGWGGFFAGFQGVTMDPDASKESKEGTQPLVSGAKGAGFFLFEWIIRLLRG